MRSASDNLLAGHTDTMMPVPRSRVDKWQTITFMGMTAMFAGYFLVWLPGPGAGLRLIGFEIGEWIKFLGVGPARNLFYLPPVILGILLALLTAEWPNDRWQTWVARGLAIAVSLLAFPAVAAITSEPPSEWLIRLVLIGLVILVVVVSSIIAGSPGPPKWLWAVMAGVALIGTILPTWQYLAIRPVVAELLNRPVGIGAGVWLNAIGGLFVVSAAIWRFLSPVQK
jgi:hypothetical protein